MAKRLRTVVAPKPQNSVFSRKFRTFLRWMSDNGIEYSDGLAFELGGSGSVADIGVKALVDMKKGDLIATIPKKACLTTLTTAASSMLEEVEIGGALGLAVALMYERSLQERSDWYGYLQLLPNAQNLPYVWMQEEIDELLAGTELHQVIKEDRVLMEEDWKECIAPLTEISPEDFPAEWFTLDQYLAAKTLINSRAFEVDEYHGYGMVPLADLFNHKTADEDVHFTSVSSDSEADSEEVETEEPPLSPAALRNGRKRDKEYELEKVEEEKSQKPRKSTKAKKKESRYDGHPVADDLQSGPVIEHEELVMTRGTRRKNSKHIEQGKDRNVLVNAAGESPKAGWVKSLRKKQIQMVKDEADTEPKTLDKPKSRRKVKAQKNRAEVLKTGDETELEVRDESTQRNGKMKRLRKEVEVQDSTKAEQFSRRGGKGTFLEEQPNSDSKVYKSSGRRGKLEHVVTPESDLGDEENHKTYQQGDGQRRWKRRQLEELRTQSSQNVEVSGDVLPSQGREGNSEILEMILVKDVAGCSEVFNTYGTLSNAALLHRYGFTELNNPFDIVNIDLSLVVDSFREVYTSRHVRRRLTKWRKVFWSSLDSQDSEYFELSATGKPEEGLLILMYIMHFSDEQFDTLSNLSDSSDSDNKTESTARLLGLGGPPVSSPEVEKYRRRNKRHNKQLEKENKPTVDLETWLLTVPVCRCMLRTLRLRNDLYPTESIEIDEVLLSATDSSKQPEKFHALRLRISERSILRKCERRVRRQLDLLKESF